MIGVDEIAVRPLGQAGQHRRRPADAQLVPTHVRHFVFGGQIEPHDFARQHAQALVPASFVADVEQQLQTQADAEKRFAGGNRLADRLDQCRRWSSAIASPNAPTPGSTILSALASTAGSLVIVAGWPTFSNPFCTLRRLPI